MFDDQQELAGGQDLNVGTERALNDVALSIGFSMMVLLFVVVSSMTALQNIAVNLPEAVPAQADRRQAGAALDVVVSLEAVDGELNAVYVDDQQVVHLDASLDAVLARRYGERLAKAGAVALQIHADGSLSHATVSDAAFRFNGAFRSLGGVSRKVTVRYMARPTD